MAGKRWQLPGGLGRFGLLWPVIALIRMIWWCAQGLDSIAARMIRRVVPPRYERTGSCLKTGMCCEYIAMSVPEVTMRWPLFLGFMLRLGEILYPFKLHARAGDEFLYTCHNFDAERRICRNYRFRPRVCRDYPEVGFFSRPKFFKGCGFSVRLRGKKGSFIEILDAKRRDVTPDFSQDLDLEAASSVEAESAGPGLEGLAPSHELEPMAASRNEMKPMEPSAERRASRTPAADIESESE